MKTIHCALFTVALLFPSWTLGESIAGVWQHENAAAWIEIDLAKNSAIVIRNDKYPERRGDIFIRHITVDESNPAVWHGEVFIRKLEAYKRVKISMSENGNMLLTGKVGFLSRTVTWLRAAPTDQ